MFIFIYQPNLLKLVTLLALLTFFSACEDEEDNIDMINEAGHESVLVESSGWTPMAFDTVIFYPPGGFSGFQNINLLQPFVHNGQPKAIAEYSRLGASGSFKNIIAVKDGKVIRQPLSGSGEVVIGEENLYRFIANDEEEFFVRRLNGPDYTSYNSFSWEARNIEREVRRLGYTTGGYISSGLPDFIHINDTINALQASYMNVGGVNGAGNQSLLVMSRTSMPANVGYVREVALAPANNDLAQSYYLDMKTKHLNDKVMTVIQASDEREAYFVFGSFDEGFDYIKTIPNIRGINAFYTGKDNFFCVLMEGGSSRSLAYKIDLNGNVTELGAFRAPSNSAFSHYKGDMVASVLEGDEYDINSIKKLSASGEEILGATPLVEEGYLEVLISDGDNLYGAAVNKVSPIYFGGGRQFSGWEFMKYE